MTTQSGKKPITFRAIAPQFIVPDVVKTAEYYRDILGFKILGYFRNPPVYAIISRGNIEIHLGKGDSNVAEGNTVRRKGGLDAYIFVNGVDDLCEEFRQRRADIIDGPVNREYNNREIVVQDCNGFVIAFGENINNPVL